MSGEKTTITIKDVMLGDQIEIKNETTDSTRLLARIKELETILATLLDHGSTEYSGAFGEDDPGVCRYCGALSYKPHATNCEYARAEKVLNDKLGKKK